MKTLLLMLLSAAFLRSPLQAQITESITFPSELGSPGGSIILLPPGYETSGLRYPVIFMLPGNGDPPGGGVLNNTQMARLMGQGEMLPVIFVAPNRDVVPSNGIIYDTIYAEHLARSSFITV